MHLDIAVFFLVLVVLLLLILAMWMIFRGIKGGYSIYQDMIGSKQKALEEEIESLKNRLEEIEKKLNL
jgi:predicted PurR-regulated permease PerM